MPIKFDLNKFNNNRIFIETGTYVGNGVKKALNSGFKRIFSIELDKKRYLECNRKFKDNKNIKILHGDSGIVLKRLLSLIKEPCTFFLDAHYCGEALEECVEIADKWCPMSEELDAILNHPIKTHTILIDDMRCIDNTHIDEKTGKSVGFPGKENLIKKLKEINPNYKIEYLQGYIKDDVLVAYIKKN
jgi:hypothetical protein